MVYVSHSDLRAAFDGFALLALCAGALGGVLLNLGVRLCHYVMDRLMAHVGGHVLVPVDVGGMGVSPMVGLSRQACPPAWGAASLGRLPDHDPLAPITPGAVGRVVKRSDEPRPTAFTPPWPHSCLIDKRAEGAYGGDRLTVGLFALILLWSAILGVTLLAALVQVALGTALEVGPWPVPPLLA